MPLIRYPTPFFPCLSGQICKHFIRHSKFNWPSSLQICVSNLGWFRHILTLTVVLQTNFTLWYAMLVSWSWALCRTWLTLTLLETMPNPNGSTFFPSSLSYAVWWAVLYHIKAWSDDQEFYSESTRSTVVYTHIFILLRGLLGGWIEAPGVHYQKQRTWRQGTRCDLALDGLSRTTAVETKGYYSQMNAYRV